MKRFTEFSDINAAREEARRRFPKVSLDSLTWAKIRDIANGDLVPVRVAGKNKFVLMTPAEVAPGGKLHQHNAQVRASNAKARAQARIQAAEFLSRDPALGKALSLANAIYSKTKEGK